MFKKVGVIVLVLLMIGVVVACTGGGGSTYIPPGDYHYHDEPHQTEVIVNPVMTQDQKQSQSQVQSQKQIQSQSVVVSDRNTLNVGEAQVYSRLVYPGEVLTYAVGYGDICSVIAAYPIGLYTISPVNGYGEDMVQTDEAAPKYDPIRHEMEFGVVPVIDKIDYWTEKASLKSTVYGYCVLDNRAPENQYVMTELTVYKGF